MCRVQCSCRILILEDSIVDSVNLIVWVFVDRQSADFYSYDSNKTRQVIGWFSVFNKFDSIVYREKSADWWSNVIEYRQRIVKCRPLSNCLSYCSFVFYHVSLIVMIEWYPFLARAIDTIRLLALSTSRILCQCYFNSVFNGLADVSHNVDVHLRRCDKSLISNKSIIYLKLNVSVRFHRWILVDGDDCLSCCSRLDIVVVFGHDESQWNICQ
jgi:hypothetical protein